MEYKKLVIKGIFCSAIWAVGNGILFFTCQMFNVFFLAPPTIRLLAYIGLFLGITIAYVFGMIFLFKYGRKNHYNGNLFFGVLLFIPLHIVLICTLYIVNQWDESLIGFINWWILLVEMILESLKSMLSPFNIKLESVIALLDKASYSYCFNAILTFIPYIIMYIGMVAKKRKGDI